MTIRKPHHRPPARQASCSAEARLASVITLLYSLVERAAAKRRVDAALVHNYIDRRLTIDVENGFLRVIRTKRAVTKDGIGTEKADIAAAIRRETKNEDQLIGNLGTYLARYVDWTAREVASLRDAVARTDGRDDELPADSTPAAGTFDTEDIDRIRAAMDRLDPLTRRAIESSIVEGKPKTQIAAETGLSRYQIARAITKGTAELRGAFPAPAEG